MSRGTGSNKSSAVRRFVHPWEEFVIGVTRSISVPPYPREGGAARSALCDTVGVACYEPQSWLPQSLFRVVLVSILSFERWLGE